MGEKRGEKVLVIGGISQFGKKVSPRLDYFFSRIFFAGEKKEGMWRWMGSSELPKLHSEQQHWSPGFNVVIYGHFAAMEVSIWLKKSVF